MYFSNYEDVVSNLKMLGIQTNRVDEANLLTQLAAKSTKLLKKS